MSTLSPKHQQYLAMADDTLPAELPEGQANNENVAELIRFIQTQSSHGSSQPTGAREMIKAGQRRLRLALRNRKGPDPKPKADDTAPPFLTLQHEASFQQRSGPKKSLESTVSISRSLTNLSFKSSSKRDVESIGQPWLGGSFEEKEIPNSKGSQFSSLDLRELTELVEAAVSFSPNFEDINPPPYEWNNSNSTETSTKQATATSLFTEGTTTSEVQHSGEANTLSNSDTLNSVPQHEALELFPSQTLSNKTCDEKVLDDKHNPSLNPNGETKTKGAAAPKASTSSTSPHPLNPPTPVLKLFPDTMPPRISSKGALRIATCRFPVPNRPLPVTPSSQQNPCPAIAETSNRDSKALPSKNSNGQDKAPTLSNSDKPTPVQSIKPSKSNHHPYSLPMGTIDAFPLPAPMRPLPSLPRPAPHIHIQSAVNVTASIPTVEPNKRLPKLDPPFNPPQHGDSKKISPIHSNSSSPDQTTTSNRLVLGAKGPGPSQGSPKQIASPNQPRRMLVRAGGSRAKRVHSLKMKDLSASRIYLNGLEKSQNIGTPSHEARSVLETTASDISNETRLDSDGRYQRKVAPGPPSLPPLSPPSDPPRCSTKYSATSRRHCTSPTIFKVGKMESSEPSSRPVSIRNSHIYRSSSQRSTKPNREKLSVPRNLNDHSETPLPSSDDEGTAGGTRRSHPPPMSSSRRRRAKPAPIIVDGPSCRERSLRKYQSSGNISPLTPQWRTSRRQERNATLQGSPKIYSFHEMYSHQPESNTNTSLEGRIEHLERQNKILQAALLAALDVGVKQDLSGMLGDSTASLSTNATPPLTGRSCSSTTNTSSSEEFPRGREKYSRKSKPSYRPESWIASPDSFGRDSYASDDSANVRELEDMIEEFDLDWMSDNSSPIRNQVSQIRF